MNKQTLRLEELRARTINYTLRRPNDHRASNLWLEYVRDFEKGKDNISGYEIRMEALEFGGDDYP